MDGAYEVVITPRAEASLEEILVYLIENVSMETAERVRSRLLEVIFNLGKMPTANPVARGIISEKGIIYRRALALSYRIVYTIKEEQLQVLVVEIHHVKRDPKAINESFEQPNSGAIPSASTRANIRYAAMLLNVARRVARH